MRSVHTVFLCAFVFALSASTTVDLNQTFALLREGEQLSAAAVADLESKVNNTPNDLGNRLRLLSYYAGRQGSADSQEIRAARAAHILWIIRNEPNAAVFDIATRVYAIERAGGLADDAAFQAAKEAWESQISSHPKDKGIRRNAATFVEIPDPAYRGTLTHFDG